MTPSCTGSGAHRAEPAPLTGRPAHGQHHLPLRRGRHPGRGHPAPRSSPAAAPGSRDELAQSTRAHTAEPRCKQITAVISSREALRWLVIKQKTPRMEPSEPYLLGLRGGLNDMPFRMYSAQHRAHKMFSTNGNYSEKTQLLEFPSRYRGNGSPPYPTGSASQAKLPEEADASRGFFIKRDEMKST